MGAWLWFDRTIGLSVSSPFNPLRLADFARGRLALPAGAPLHVELRPLGGGLQSPAVGEVRVRACANGRRLRDTFVVKRLPAPQRREAQVYDWLQQSSTETIAPRLLGRAPAPDGGVDLYLERIRPTASWPWSQIESASRVIDRLAELHERAPRARFREFVADWRYEAELQDRAALTRSVLEGAHRSGALPGVRPLLGPVRRVVESLPALRRQITSAAPFGTAVLHGDVHAGNALLRAGRTSQAVLLDWGRAREGCPLEDVSSWLQSLAHWEPQVRRRHDTLFERYLRARGMPGTPGPTMRQAYWLAGASNALAGALLFHVWQAGETRHSEPAAYLQAVAAARDWLRIVRRADAAWRA